MSELIDNTKFRQDGLYRYLEILVSGHATKEQYFEYKPLIDTITPRDAIFVVDRIMKSGSTIANIKTGVNKFITGTSSTLLSYPLPEYPDTSALSLLSQENNEIKKRMEECKPFVQELNKRAREGDSNIDRIAELLAGMKGFGSHYAKLQNVLFPAVEAQWPDFRCTQLMWSYHADIERNLSSLTELVNAAHFDHSAFNAILGRFYFDVYAMIFREEHILFPEIHRQVAPQALRKLYVDCFDIGFSYIDPPPITALPDPEDRNNEYAGVDLGTGSLSAEQIALMLNTLPCDVTFVNEDDEVAYFSSPRDRIFPRSPAVIGRKVQNCHPPESVHVVQGIVDSFRNGSSSNAEFWIDMGGDKIHIQYFALRDADGQYRGTLEVSQNITALQSLTGEKRLLHQT